MNGRMRTPWGDDLSDEDDDDQTRLLGQPQPDYQTTQQRQIREHEQGLDKLGEAIKRQKHIANEIATEVDVHNEILDNIDDGLERTNQNIRKNTRNINVVLRKSSTLCLWFLIILLAIVIVILAII